MLHRFEEMATQAQGNGNTSSRKWLHKNGNMYTQIATQPYTTNGYTYIYMTKNHTHIHINMATHMAAFTCTYTNPEQCNSNNGYRKMQHKLLHQHVQLHVYTHII